MTEISYEDRLQLRRTLKWSLRTESWRTTESNGVPKYWYQKKLEGMAAYALVKERMPRRIISILQLHLAQGIPLNKIAFELKLSTRQVIRNLNKGLDLIIDNAPIAILVSLSPGTYRWLLQGCRRCGGDVYWDPEGAHGLDGEYCCMLCSERYTVEEMEEKRVQSPIPKSTT
jgi:hypothetical protein